MVPCRRHICTNIILDSNWNGHYYNISAYVISASRHIKISWFNQHPLKRRPDYRKVATSQTSELVGKAPKTCNSYPDAIFK